MQHPRSTRRIVGLAVALAIASVALSRPARAASQESLVRDACLRTWFEGVTAEDAHREVGLSGVPILLQLLAEPDFPRRDNVVAFLTHLGGAESTPAILGFLGAPPSGAAAPEEDRALLLAPQALGHIAGRGDPAALAAVLALAREGAGVDGAVTASPHADMRDDLRAMALRGLAIAGGPAALATLEQAATGPSPALRRAAAQSLALLSEGGPSAAEPSAAEPHAEEPSASIDPSVLDGSARARELAVTWGNHVSVTSPMTDVQLDAVLGRASLVMGRSDFSGDVACCASLARSGSAGSFGTPGDGLDVIDDGTELSQVLGESVGRFKVVRAINYCGAPGVNIAGCATVGGNGIAVVRYPSSTATEAVIWAHELGHNVGLSHNAAGSPFVMSAVVSGSTVGLTQTECDRYHGPAGGSAVVQTDVGACTDGDVDDVQDAIDNCPLVANETQADANGNGIGDLCECAGGPCGCGNGTVESGEECDDGNDVEGDGCTGACTSCGNGVTASTEECDDGNLVDGDGCSAECLSDCPTSPPAGCAEAGTSSLVMKDASISTRLVDWKWSRGEATSKADFGNPRSQGAWTACLWSAGNLAMTAHVPASALWQEKTKGWLYKDARGSADGATKIQLQEGTAGKSKAQVQLKGVRVPVPDLAALVGPLVFQLRGGSTCHVSTFVAPFAKQASDRLVAKTVIR